MRKDRLIKSCDIPYASDYDISKSIDNLKERLGKFGPSWRLSKNKRILSQCLEIETELCYLQREVMWRKKRELCHKEYLRNRFSN